MAQETEGCKRKEQMLSVWPQDFPTLTIRGFSCIKDLTVEFRRLVVIIGEQASGKSITCKLYYFFTQALQKVAEKCLREELGADDFRKRLVQEFGAIFPLPAWQQDAFTIDWQNGARRVRITHGSGNKRIKLELFDYKKRYDDALSKIHLLKYPSDVRDTFEVRWRFDRDVEQVISEQFLSLNVDYIPAGRSFFATIQDVVFSLLSNNIGIDYFLKEFGQNIEIFRQISRRRTIDILIAEKGRKATFDNLCQRIIHGNYLYDGKEQWIVTDKDHKVRLADASSGQQEALPLLMVLSQYGSSFHRRSEYNRFLIEEPEAHLYPTAQQCIIDVIGGILQDWKSQGCIITTHSPFILCCINNVLKQQPKLQKAISAYHLHDGGGDVIYDADLGMINATRFDDASFAIANA